MAGRGKELTLPAWMTSGSGVSAATSESQSITTTAPSTLTNLSSASASFAESSVPQPLAPAAIPPAGLVGVPGPMVPAFPPPILAGMPPMMPPMMAPRFPPPYGMPPGSMPMPGGFSMPGFFPGAMMPSMMPPPRFIPPPTSKPVPASAPGAPVERTTDPNNDITCWTEHKTEDGRRYWYNSVTLASTYEKPLCLKTPEERSIPPCPWKEYTSPEGKVYYSNGTDSSWTMPEEYRIWKEKIDSIEKRLLEKKEAAKHHDMTATKPHHNKNQPSKQAKQNTTTATENIQIPTFKSVSEAMEAFKEMLGRYEISATAKLKEVTDICSDDPIWNAITSNGERKQALAEYQTKRLKQEKEELKLRQRKRRDAFLLMLAENTEIDFRTRWRTAQDILKDDIRYKNIEDMREREDLFQEFINELEKKEREDRVKNREKCVTIFKNILQEMKSDGVIHARSIYAEHKDNLLTLLTQRPDLKSLDESDIRRLFIDLTTQLQSEIRQQEREFRELQKRQLESRILEVKTYFEKLVKDGFISAQTRWKDLLHMSQVMENSSIVDLKKCFSPPKNNNETVVTGNSETADEMEFLRILNQTFNRVVEHLQESYREDKKNVKRMLSIVKSADLSFDVNTTYDQLYMCVLAFANLREELNTHSSSGNKQLEVITEARDSATSGAVTTAADHDDDVEEGEERDPILPNPIQLQLQSMMLTRPATLQSIFRELHDKAVEEHEEEERYRQKNEVKYLSLLREYFYLSDHVNITWDEAKPILSQRSSYDAVGKHERRRLFALHMSQLREKMEQRTLSMKASGIASASSAAASAAMEMDDGGREAAALTGKKRERSESMSHSQHLHHDRQPHASSSQDRDRGGAGHHHGTSRSRERSAASRDRDRDGRGRSKDGRR